MHVQSLKESEPGGEVESAGQAVAVPSPVQYELAGHCEHVASANSVHGTDTNVPAAQDVHGEHIASAIALQFCVVYPVVRGLQVVQAEHTESVEPEHPEDL
jgi:hypothetical protein